MVRLPKPSNLPDQSIHGITTLLTHSLAALTLTRVGVGKFCASFGVPIVQGTHTILNSPTCWSVRRVRLSCMRRDRDASMVPVPVVVKPILNRVLTLAACGWGDCCVCGMCC